jgi:fructose-bisphosphate aldolase class I
VAVNAQQLAEYAAAAQAAGLVPIVEPEVLVMEGAHDLWVSEEVSAMVLSAVFAALLNRRVLLEGLVLKPAMILPGSDSSSSSSSGSDEVAATTLRVLRRTVPPAVPGIAFLSGGQTEQQAAQLLAALNQLCMSADCSSSSSSSSRACMCPWALTFSFGRALQASALQTWAGDQADVAGAQALFGRAVATAGKAAAGVTAAVAEEAAAAEGVDAVGACAVLQGHVPPL